MLQQREEQRRESRRPRLRNDERVREGWEGLFIVNSYEGRERKKRGKCDFSSFYFLSFSLVKVNYSMPKLRSHRQRLLNVNANETQIQIEIEMKLLNSRGPPR